MKRILYTGLFVIVIVHGFLTKAEVNEDDRIIGVPYTTNESSTRQGFSYDSDAAFDGHIGPTPGRPNGGPPVCSHTKKEDEPWWYIKFNDTYVIDYVQLYNRQGYSERLAGAQIRVGNSTSLKENRACGKNVSNSEARHSTRMIERYCGEVGHIVSVQLENIRQQFLTLCEVKIYGTLQEVDPTTFGTKLLSTVVTVTDTESTTRELTYATTTGLTSAMNTRLTLSHQQDNFPYLEFSDYLSRNLAEGEVLTFNIGESRGFIARLFKNGSLPKRKVVEDLNDTVTVELQIELDQDPKFCIALYGRPKQERYDNLTKSKFKNKESNVNATSEIEVATDIFQSYIYNSNKQEVSGGIKIDFTFPTTTNRYVQLRKKPESNVQPTCAFFNESLSVWSTSGCVTEEHNEIIKCTCNHTTSYAILFQTSESTISDEDQTILSTLTYAGLTVSTVFLIFALITQNILPALRKSMRFKILTNLIIAAILSNIVFLTSELAQDQEIACTIYAGLLHYSILVVFVWMMIFSADLYAKVFYSFANHHKRLHWSRFVGWGLPFIVVVVTAAITTSEYVSDSSCWLDYNSGAVFGFIGPATFVVLINIGLITRVLVEVSKKTRSANVTQKRKLDDIKSVAIRASLLLPVVGITWISGFFLLYYKNEVVFHYVFVIANTLQGILIWLTQFFWSREVKNAWTSMKRKNRSKQSLKKKSENGKFTGIGVDPTSPPESTMENTYSLSAKKSLTQTSDLPLSLDSDTFKSKVTGKYETN